ncbi:Adaptor protein complex large chain subunit BetaA [Giardia muris]|uniref:Adaptor protein complex large chain subunit BetaA n=1 Tax=Giardia muris TaxID=5742 RepID=A0A4Z1T5B3_GIAMU|nr:Adaptor protein complex large chain subunit BetaA [Giardia muris]|eukprot:TNJ27651.1 Adaptor protein complex large chain subunit BetaA [Giardia muris]
MSKLPDQLLEQLHKGDDARRKALTKALTLELEATDVELILPEVVKLLPVKDSEVRRLVELFLLQYGGAFPTISQLAINTLRRDASGPSPTRINAIKLLGQLSTDQLVQHTLPALTSLVGDECAEVRTTLATIFGRILLDHRSLEKEDEEMLLETLRRYLTDPQLTVVAAAASALCDVLTARGLNPHEGYFDSELRTRILKGLNGLSEWVALLVLQIYESYKPQAGEETMCAIEHLFYTVQSTNSALMLQALRILVSYIGALADKRMHKRLMRRLVPIIISLACSENDSVQYATLSALPTLIQRYPSLLLKELEHLLPCYTDQSQVKLLKLNIIIFATHDSNATYVLKELANFSLSEPDPEIARACVSTLGKVAIRLSSQTERVLNALRFILLSSSNNFRHREHPVERDVPRALLEEVLIVYHRLMYRYPLDLRSELKDLLRVVDTMESPDAQIAHIDLVTRDLTLIPDVMVPLRVYRRQKNATTSLQLMLIVSAYRAFLSAPAEKERQAREAFLRELLQEYGNVAFQPLVSQQALFYTDILNTVGTDARELLELPLGQIHDTLAQTQPDERDLTFSLEIPTLGLFDRL